MPVPTAQPRLPWTFDRTIPTPELRVARATEYMAHYLERIDGHLERIANAVETGNVNEKLRNEIATISGILQKKP